MGSVEFYGGLDRDRFCELARTFAGKVKKGAVVGLIGDLGTGKTTFCAEVINYLSRDEFLGSPTFAIVNSYTCYDFSLYHIDLYRISSAAELREVGIFDIADEKNVLFIEWPEVLEGKISFDVIITIRDTVDTDSRMRDVTIETNP